MPLSVIAAGLSAIKTGFELIRSAREKLGRPEVDPAEIQARLLELQALMLEAQKALGDADEEMRALKRQVEELEAEKVRASNLTFAHEVYWNRNAEGKLDGPYCPTCWDHTKTLARLKFHSEGEYSSYPGISRLYDCVLHRTTFFLPKDIFGPGAVIK